MSQPPSAPRPQVILFGDSLTQMSFSVEANGWGACLADWYARRADVLNRGFSGYTSRWVLPVLGRFESAPSPPLVTVMLGSNDAAVPASNRQHVPLHEFQQNMEAILAQFRKLHAHTRFVLITPPPVDADTWTRVGKGGRSLESTAQYAQCVRDIAKAQSIPLVDLWEGENKIDASDLSDGLHFAAGGNAKVFRGVRAAIRANFPEFVPDDEEGAQMGLHFPDHKELEGNWEGLIRQWKGGNQ